MAKTITLRDQLYPWILSVTPASLLKKTWKEYSRSTLITIQSLHALSVEGDNGERRLTTIYLHPNTLARTMGYDPRTAARVLRQLKDKGVLKNTLSK